LHEKVCHERERGERGEGEERVYLYCIKKGGPAIFAYYSGSIAAAYKIFILT
jgi:hypothetical protein